MSRWKQKALGEIFDIARGGSPRPINDYLTDSDDGINWIMIGDASLGSKYITQTRKRIRREGVSRSRRVFPGDFLLTNSMSFGHPYVSQIEGCIHDGWLVLSPRSSDVDTDFFWHLLGSPMVFSAFAKQAAGATVKNLNIDLVAGVSVPMPALVEQKRIAAILDKADAIRRKRQEAIRLTEELLRSAFLEMFGDPVTNPKGWEVRQLGDCLVAKPRNGLSPATAGSHPGRVLTLSAITRGVFQPKYAKTASFDKVIPAEKTVSTKDMLICRGNGNLALVGAGCFPTEDMPDVAFPDTAIGVRPGPSIKADYLEALWTTQHIRSQIEGGARTTNGTYKINQKVLEGIQLPVPPVDQQLLFAEAAAVIRRLKARLASEQETEMAGCLTQRAFSGRL